jgi:hypothetical protein
VEEMTGSRAEVARDINRRVLETAAVFDDHADNHVPFDFERVTISPARYLTLGGAWLDGHCDPNE